MCSGWDNAGEEEESVYQPSMQIGVGGSQDNDMDASSVATNATSVEYIENPGLSGCGHGRGQC
jgi:hypothetical protein